jgi:hypothetical protein
VVASRAVGFGEPRRDAHSPEFNAYEQDGEEQAEPSHPRKAIHAHQHQAVNDDGRQVPADEDDVDGVTSVAEHDRESWFVAGIPSAKR